MGTQYFGIIISVVSSFLIFEFPSAVNAEGKSIGRLYECAHDLKGEVFVKNEKEITIKGFNYDGKGPGAWFHAQLKGSKGVSSDGNFLTIPFNGTCDVLNKKYTNEEVSLILPKTIKEFVSIGIFCYEYCSDFGHVIIPKDLSVAAAPADLKVPDACPKSKFNPCTVTGTKTCRDFPVPDDDSDEDEDVGFNKVTPTPTPDEDKEPEGEGGTTDPSPDEDDDTDKEPPRLVVDPTEFYEEGPKDLNDMAAGVLRGAWDNNMKGVLQNLNDSTEYPYIDVINTAGGEERLYFIRLLELMDSNMDTKISRDELISLYSGPMGSSEQAIELMFRVHDFDGNGYISIYETLNRLLTVDGLNMNVLDKWKDSIELNKMMDSDGDMRVNMQEFVTFMVWQMNTGIAASPSLVDIPAEGAETKDPAAAHDSKV